MYTIYKNDRLRIDLDTSGDEDRRCLVEERPRKKSGSRVRLMSFKKAVWILAIRAAADGFRDGCRDVLRGKNSPELEEADHQTLGDLVRDAVGSGGIYKTPFDDEIPAHLEDLVAEARAIGYRRAFP